MITKVESLTKANQRASDNDPISQDQNVGPAKKPKKRKSKNNKTPSNLKDSPLLQEQISVT